MPSQQAPCRLALYASGRGSNVAAILQAWRRGDLNRGARPVLPCLLICNRAEAGAIDLAQESGLPYAVIEAKAPDFGAKEQLHLLAQHQIDAIALAGYLKKVPDAVVHRYPDKILNIHPGPLPRFGGAGMFGRHVHQAVIEAKVPQSGPTVHRVDEVYDRGPVLAHRPVPVLPEDKPETLAERVLKAEHDLFWRVIAQEFGQDQSALANLD